MRVAALKAALACAAATSKSALAIARSAGTGGTRAEGSEVAVAEYANLGMYICTVTEYSDEMAVSWPSPIHQEALWAARPQRNRSSSFNWPPHTWTSCSERAAVLKQCRHPMPRLGADHVERAIGPVTSSAESFSHQLCRRTALSARTNRCGSTATTRRVPVSVAPSTGQELPKSQFWSFVAVLAVASTHNRPMGPTSASVCASSHTIASQPEKADNSNSDSNFKAIPNPLSHPKMLWLKWHIAPKRQLPLAAKLRHVLACCVGRLHLLT